MVVLMVPVGETWVGAAGGWFPAGAFTVNSRPALHALVPYAFDALTYHPHIAAAIGAEGVNEQVPEPEPQPALDGDTAILTATPFRFCTSSQ